MKKLLIISLLGLGMTGCMLTKSPLTKEAQTFYGMLLDKVVKCGTKGFIPDELGGRFLSNVQNLFSMTSYDEEYIKSTSAVGFYANEANCQSVRTEMYSVIYNLERNLKQAPMQQPAPSKSGTEVCNYVGTQRFCTTY